MSPLKAKIETGLISNISHGDQRKIIDFFCNLTFKKKKFDYFKLWDNSLQIAFLIHATDEMS
jgi:hypothetical protein